MARKHAQGALFRRYARTLRKDVPQIRAGVNGVCARPTPPPEGPLHTLILTHTLQVHWTTVTGGGFRPAGAGPGREPDPAFCHAGRNGYEDRSFVEYLLELK